ncbi:MAG: ATP-binding cassette domain-containing protein [Lachnospiraceae bacterium]|jgi:peptide/nickel transport system ATP-binding protein|nr:ATP-binding cassette domain-containing protein [Lachnospiraceae bacterium]
MMGALEAKNISFGYDRKRKVLDDVSISVGAGERVALVGPSGCGKSTLCKVLAGHLEPWSGEVTLDGEALFGRDAGQGTGFEPWRGPGHGHRPCPVQLIYQHPEKAVNPRRKLGKTLTEAYVPGEDVLRALGIEPAWSNRYPAELSGGELQRFCIARALAPGVEFIVADEISTMLDVVTQAQIWQALIRICEVRHIGLVAVTHSPELAARISTRVVELLA